MEARVVNNLPPAAAHDGAARCLLAIELSKKGWLLRPLRRPIRRYRTQAGRTWWLLPARLHVVGLVLRASRGRSGRDPAAAERHLSARLDAQRQLPAQTRAGPAN